MTERAPRIEIFSWCLFDFANSSFTTIILTVCFGIVLTDLIVKPDVAPGISEVLWHQSPGTQEPELHLIVPGESTRTARGVAESYVRRHWQHSLDAQGVLLDNVLAAMETVHSSADSNSAAVTVRIGLPPLPDGVAPVTLDLLIKSPRGEGNLIWAWTLAGANLIVVVLGPLLGAVADGCSAKKRFLFASYVVCIAFTALLYFATPGRTALAVALVLMATAGFAASENFISSFLPSLGPREELGKISGYAWSIGYFGGLFSIVCVRWVSGLDYFPELFPRLRWIGPVTAAFFLIAGLPTFLWLREPQDGRKLTGPTEYWSLGFRRIAATLRSLPRFRDLAVFLLSFFFIMAALNIVISFASVYGKQEVAVVGNWQLWFFVLLQLTAAAGAFLAGFLQDRMGSKLTINLTLIVWIATITGIYAIKDLSRVANDVLGLSLQPRAYFLIVGNVAGLCLGATQSAARALIGKFSPLGRAGEFFGFWGFSGKLAAAFGLAAFAMQDLSSLKRSVPLCVLFFGLALVIMWWVDEARGMRTASECVDDEAVEYDGQQPSG